MATICIKGVTHIYELTPPPPQAAGSEILVFIHGWLLSRKYWQPLIEILSNYYQCLTYDIRGFGESEAVASNHYHMPSSSAQYTLAAYAEDLKILLEQLQIEQAWLIGHSLGGSIALWGAKLIQTVNGVVCLNAGGGIYLKEEFERFRAVGSGVIKRRIKWLDRLPLVDLIFARTMVSRPLTQAWGRQRVKDFVGADANAAIRALLDTTTEAEVHLLPQLVAQLTQPVYFIAGQDDRVMPTKYVHHLASFHPCFHQENSNVIEISDCGHLAMLEQPEIVAEYILRFLQRHRG